MSKQLLIASAVAGVLTMGSYPALPAQPSAGAPTEQAGQQQPIYGSQLMTPAERAEYRAKMASLKTQEEREALRLEHHKQMQERAKQMGVTLPEVPSAGGGMVGPGAGGMMGPGAGGGMMGPGGGMMGPGGGMGRGQ
jgi:hypothetical protein